MTTEHQVDLPDGTAVVAKARWSWSAGTPGTLSDARGWELIESWVPGRPVLSLAEREHVRRQLVAPEGGP